ncbi:SDR family NAD(P)-dependent oxidoreductase [Fretibacter rubidus]|uniref:SDR family NAD(P)-dependent oxidoreductase n=1 Tax=Fretibacter rubidus TaxID=570162 RepID=UPI00352AC615
MMIDKTFAGKICVVTGAASGIGRAVAQRLHQAGAVLALCDIDAQGLTETRAMLGEPVSNRVMTDCLDLADATAIAAYADHVAQTLGPADYVFNIAGLARVGTFDTTPLSSFETVMNVNFYGVVRMSKAFLGQLKQTRGGLVNVSSIFGIIGYPGQAHYCASKFAVRGFSETLAQELDGTGVSVSCVHPGGVATNIARNAQIDAMPAHGKSKDVMDADFDKVAITSADKAADIILTGTAKRKRRIIVGGDAKMIQLISRLFPQSYARILRRLNPDSYEVL